MSITPDTINTKFNFCQIELTPYTGNGLAGSVGTGRKIFNKIMQLRGLDEVKFFDKNVSNGGEPRFIGVLQCVFIPKKDVLKGKVILLRAKNPSLINDNYEIDHIKDLDNKKFAEVTHFCINYKHHRPLLMIEKNQNGPRISDLEYFLRHFGKEFRIAKYCNLVPLINSVSSDIVNRITSVDFIDLKVDEKKQKALTDVSTSYYSGAQLINSESAYKTLRIATTYDKKGSQRKQVGFAKKILNKILNNPDSADDFAILQMGYQLDNEGDFLKFDLIRDKVEVDYDTGLSAPGVAKSKELFEQAINEIVDFKIN